MTWAMEDLTEELNIAKGTVARLEAELATARAETEHARRDNARLIEANGYLGKRVEALDLERNELLDDLSAYQDGRVSDAIAIHICPNLCCFLCGKINSTEAYACRDCHGAAVEQAGGTT